MAFPTSDGCTVCQTQATETADGVNGRRCTQHPAQFDPAHAVRLMAGGQHTSALAYARTSFPTQQETR